MTYTRNYIILTLLLVVSLLLAVTLGAVSLSPAQLFREDSATALIIWKIRLPRAIGAIITGASLAVAGAATQNLFRNPLATPGIIGTSGGAGLGALMVMLLIPFLSDWEWIGTIMISTGAFAGAILATLFIYYFSSRNGFTNLTYLLIGGLGVNIFTSAFIALLLYFSDDFTLRNYTYWTMGDLGRLSADYLPLVFILTLAGVFFVFRNAKALDVMALGESEARHMGVPVQVIKKETIIAVGLLVGIAVSTAGIIGFIGLMVPHLLRTWGIQRMRHLLFHCLLLGPVFLLTADWLGRIAIAPAELPAGIITSFIGAPYLLYVLAKSKRIFRL